MILQEEGLTSESYFRVKLEEREFWNFENLKWEIENIFCIVCELKESESILLPALTRPNAYRCGS